MEAIRNGCDIYASSVYCPACSAKRLKAKKETDREIKLLAERYEDCGITEEIIRNLMDKKADLDDRAKLIGIRLGLGTSFTARSFSPLMTCAMSPAKHRRKP